MNSRLCRKSNKNGNLFFSAHSLIFYHLFICFVDVNSLWNAIRTWNWLCGIVRWRKRFSRFLLVLGILLLDTRTFAFGHFHNRDNALGKKRREKKHIKINRGNSKTFSFSRFFRATSSTNLSALASARKVFAFIVIHEEWMKLIA